MVTNEPHLWNNNTSRGEKVTELMNLLSDLQTPLLLPQVPLLATFRCEFFFLLAITVVKFGVFGITFSFAFGGGCFKRVRGVPKNTYIQGLFGSGQNKR
jgi:hypothetical protein